MSVHVMSWVLRHSDERLGRRLVLLALADHAAEDGSSAWPSVETIAQQARLSERQARWCLRELEAAGAIVATGKSRSGTTVYRVVMAGGADSAPRKNPAEEGGRIVQTSCRKLPPIRPKATVKATAPPVSPPQRLSNVALVYDYWRQQLGKTRASYDKISPARKAKIEARLREFTVEDLLTAIDGVKADPWIERPQHNDLTKIFRSREQVDRFIEFAENGVPGRRMSAREIATQYDHLLKEDPHDLARSSPPGRHDQGGLPALESRTRDSGHLP